MSEHGVDVQRLLDRMADIQEASAATNFDATVSLGLVNGPNAGTITLQAKSSTAVQLQIQAASFCREQ